MVCRMVRMDWMYEARNFLVYGPCPWPRTFDTADYWLSFCSALVRDLVANPTGWSEVQDTLKNTLLASAYKYMLFHVMPEPTKDDNLRQRLRCRCSSCYIINKLLADSKRTRQIYSISKASAPQDERMRADARVSFAIPGRDVQHIDRQLSKGDFGCSHHTRMTRVAGPMFVIQKELRSQQWLKWKKRKDKAAFRLRDLIHSCVAGTVSDSELAKWLSLDFLNRRELEWMIPFRTEDPLDWEPALYLKSLLINAPLTKKGTKYRVSRIDGHAIKLSWKPI